MKKALKKTLKIFALIIALLIIAVMLLYAFLWIIRGSRYKESMALREPVVMIPEVNSGYTMQGIGYSKETDTYIMTGYKNKDDAVMYIATGYRENALVNLLGADGKPLTGHSGGVTCTKDYVYIANDYTLTVFSFKEIKAAAGTDSAVSPKKIIPVDNRAAYCFSDDTHIYVGEFYREQNYKTAESHHYTTPAGDAHQPLSRATRSTAKASFRATTPSTPYPSPTSCKALR